MKTHKPYIGSSNEVWQHTVGQELIKTDTRYWMNLASKASTTSTARWKTKNGALSAAKRVNWTFDFDFTRKIYIHRHIETGMWYYMIYIVVKEKD